MTSVIRLPDMEPIDVELIYRGLALIAKLKDDDFDHAEGLYEYLQKGLREL